MANPDDIRSALGDAGASIDPGDMRSARDAAHDSVRRRHRRTVLGASLATIALVAGGVVAVSNMGDSDDTTRLVSADPTEPETTDPNTTDAVTTDPTTPPDSTSPDTSSPDTTAADPTATSMVPGVDGVALDVPGAAAAAPPVGDNGVQWSTAWRDGFLVGGMSYEPQPLPTELPEDVVALFPPEVTELFADGLPPTIQEATEMLSEAGLLDVVTDVLAEHPEASEAIYATPAPAPIVQAWFTQNGSAWEPVELGVPADVVQIQQVVGAGEHLLVVGNAEFAGPSGPGQLNVATTSDLETWDVHPVGSSAADFELPAYVNEQIWVQSVAANDSGWVVIASQSFDLDVMALVPADVRERIDRDANGVGTGFSDEGVEIQLGFDESGNPSETLRYSFEELDVDPEVVDLVTGASAAESQTWAAPWGGAPTRAALDTSYGTVVATDAGFIQWTEQTWFSPDGVNWTASPLPMDGGVSTTLTYGDGAVVLAYSRDGESSWFRVGPTGGDPVRVEIPGLPEGAQMGGSWGGSAGSAQIVDTQEGMEPPSVPAVLEADGYQLELYLVSGDYELIDVATGQVVVAEQPGSEPFDEERYDYLTSSSSGMAIVDPETGDTLVTFAQEDLDRAVQEVWGDPDEQIYEPDNWVVATPDGERFMVQDLPDGDPEEWIPVMVVGDDESVLVQSGSNWTVYDLR